VGAKGSALKRVYKPLIAAFVAFHVTSLAWWLIPADGLPKDSRMIQPPSWLASAESRVFEFKKRHRDSLAAKTLERWTFLTASWQNWRLFAPNPPIEHNWVAVYGVIGWTDDSIAGRIPVYDPIPIYRSYDGRIGPRMAGHASLYKHDPKLIENLSSGDWNRALGGFAEYWARAYREERGQKPLAVHVMLHTGHITGDEPPTSRVICYYTVR
jgi:hypothetical protein